MLAAEADRRVPPLQKSLEKLAKGSKPDAEAIEELRVEVHGLKGAALVIGEQRLGRLAERAEQLLSASEKEGTLDAELAGKLSDSMRRVPGRGPRRGQGRPGAAVGRGRARRAPLTAAVLR